MPGSRGALPKEPAEFAPAPEQGCRPGGPSRSREGRGEPWRRVSGWDGRRKGWGGGCFILWLCNTDRDFKAVCKGVLRRGRGAGLVGPWTCVPGWLQHIPKGMEGSRCLFCDRESPTRSHRNRHGGCWKGKMEQASRRAFSRGGSCETRPAQMPSPGRGTTSRLRKPLRHDPKIATVPRNPVPSSLPQFPSLRRLRRCVLGSMSPARSRGTMRCPLPRDGARAVAAPRSRSRRLSTLPALEIFQAWPRAQQGGFVLQPSKHCRAA